MLMDLSQLHVFLTVAREQSFSRAAGKLYRTQPAVSIVIRKLEESVGQPLPVRGARQVKLTDGGGVLELLPRRRKALPHSAGGEHRHAQARRIGRAAAAGARRAPGEAHRRG